MLTVLTQIDKETACEWIVTMCKIRERRLVRQNDQTAVSVGSAVIHLLRKLDGIRTIKGIWLGRFDERVAQHRRNGEHGQRGGRTYFEALPTDDIAIGSSTQGSILDALQGRELHVAQLLGAGHTQREIAAQYNVSEMAVSKWVAAIREKIQNQV